MSAADVPGSEQVPPFGVRRSVHEGRTVLALDGELDIASAQQAGEALSQAQAAGGHVVLDLRALRFMDSSGLRVVLEAQRRASGSGRLEVVPGEGEVRRVFELSGVGALLNLVEAPPPEVAP